MAIFIAKSLTGQNMLRSGLSVPPDRWLTFDTGDLDDSGDALFAEPLIATREVTDTDDPDLSDPLMVINPEIIPAPDPGP